MCNLTIICKEVDKTSGKVAVYEIKAPVTDSLIVKLSLRSRLNPELRYFVIHTVKWDECHDEIVKLLSSKSSLLDRRIELYGGIFSI